MGQPQGTRRAWWHPVTPVHTVPAGTAHLLSPQNSPQLLLHDLACRQLCWGHLGCIGTSWIQPHAPCPHWAVPVISLVLPLHPHSGPSLPCVQGHPAASRALLLLPWALPAGLWLGNGIKRGQQSYSAFAWHV